MKRPHILIIDDEESASTALSHILEKLKMKTTVVREGREAIDAAMTGAFDLIVLDIKLPLSEVDGWQVLQALRSEKKTSTIPVIVLSNAGLQHEVDRGLELGADEYLLKAHHSIHEIAERISKMSSLNEA